MDLIDELVDRTAAQLEGRRYADVTGFPAPCHADVIERTRADGDAHLDLLSTAEISTCVIAAPDRPGLFASVVGVLSLHGVDVLSADVWTTEDGTAVDEFGVMRRLGGDTDWPRVEHDLRDASGGHARPAEQARRPHPHLRQGAQAQAAAAPRLEVLIDNGASTAYTVIEVRAPDGIAVLHRLASALYEAGLDLAHAKVATLGHEVVDVFYVTTGSPSAKVPEIEHDALRARLVDALTAADP